MKSIANALARLTYTSTSFINLPTAKPRTVFSYDYEDSEAALGLFYPQGRPWPHVGWLAIRIFGPVHRDAIQLVLAFLNDSCEKGLPLI